MPTPFIRPPSTTALQDPSLLDDPRYAAEPKFDGQRAQLHIDDRRTGRLLASPVESCSRCEADRVGRDAPRAEARLRAAEKAVRAMGARHPMTPKKGGLMRRLLVVDDDPDITLTFKAILSSEGYDVATAGDGVAALELVRQAPFDLILLDLLLPGMDGWTILQHIREITPGARVLILGADVDPHGTVEAFRLGAVDVLSKPPDIDKLLRFVDELTRRPEDQPPTGT